MRFEITVNGERRKLDVEPDTPLLWVLRDTLALTGTKYGCGRSQCGACTVYVGGRPIRSCVRSVESVAKSGKDVVTIEGLSGAAGAAVQRAWVELDVPQCGYCQSGQVMAAAALLEENPQPDDSAIDRALSGNVCRCATYERIRGAIHKAAADLAGSEAGGEKAS